MKDNKRKGDDVSALAKFKIPKGSPTIEGDGKRVGTTLEALNLDCLEFIFRKLCFNDLVSIGQTCTKFRDIARLVFCLAHKNVVYLEPNINADFIQVFGQQITGLSTIRRQMWIDPKTTEDFLSRLQQNCVNVNYLSLNIDDIALLSSGFVRQIAHQITKLVLDISSTSATVNDELLFGILQKCVKLENLIIIFADCINLEGLFQLTFPMLQRLQFFVNTDEFTRRADIFADFIRKHSNLTHLNIYAPMAVGHLSVLHELKSLQLLVMHTTKLCKDNLAPVLKNLPLKLLSYHTSLTEAHLSELFATVSHLHLYIEPPHGPKLKFNQMVTQLRLHADVLNNLKSLDFVKPFYKTTITRNALNSFVKFVENCPSLEHISVCDGIFMNDGMYLKLVTARMKNQKRAKTLFVYIRDTAPEQNLISQIFLAKFSDIVYVIV